MPQVGCGCTGRSGTAAARHLCSGGQGLFTAGAGLQPDTPAPFGSRGAECRLLADTSDSRAARSAVAVERRIYIFPDLVQRPRTGHQVMAVVLRRGHRLTPQDFRCFQPRASALDAQGLEPCLARQRCGALEKRLLPFSSPKSAPPVTSNQASTDMS